MRADRPRSAVRGLWATIGLVFSLFLTFGGCETGFEPFQESDRYFSIFGFLDVAADTQFVRVTPLRDTLFTTDPALDAVVTLEHLATGETAVLQDSVFRFEGGVVHNFWTTMPLLAGASYRLTATRPDGAASAATVRMPDDFPTPEIIDQGAFGPLILSMPGVERLADVRFFHRIYDANVERERVLPFSHLDEVSRNTVGYVLRIDVSEDLADIASATGGNAFLLYTEYVVSAAGPDWPDLEGVDLETLALADAFSNVEDGVGFLGAVWSKTAVFRQPGDI